MSRIRFHEAVDRERTVAEVMLHAVSNRLACKVLVIDDLDGIVEEGLKKRGFEVVRWCRWKVGDRTASTWPETTDGGYGLVLMRLPRIKDAFEMALHAAASVMADGAELLVCGANDEGIKSSPSLLETVFEQNFTLDTRKHCRVMVARTPKRDDLRDSLKKWERDLDERLYYPGVFARGAVDPGTAMLLKSLPNLPGTILDFACGAGVIAAGIPGNRARITMSDADAVALEAARKNVPEAAPVLSDGFFGVKGKFDAIVSNPPMHRGTMEDFTVIRDLIEKSPEFLNPGGKLIFVVQRQIPLKTWPEAYSEVKEIGGDTRFKVLSCTLKS